MKALLFVAAMSVSTFAASTPHLATDLIAGNLDHARTHVSQDAAITKMWYGKRVAVTIEDVVENFKGCKFLRFAPSIYYPEQGNAVIFDCGQGHDEILQTGGLQDGIFDLHFYSDAVAMPGPPPGEKQ